MSAVKQSLSSRVLSGPLVRLAAALAIALPLVACGGGSDGQIAQTESAPMSVANAAEVSVARVAANTVMELPSTSALATPVSAPAPSGSTETPVQAPAPAPVGNKEADTGTAQAQGSGNAPTHATEIGMNLPQLSYWDRSFAMADVVRQSSFTNIAAPEGATQDPDGSPRGDFNLFFTSTAVAAGTYKLAFTGRATLRVIANPAGKIENQHYDATTNRTTADLVLPGGSTGNSWMEFRTTRRSASSIGNDGVTDIHLWRPGYPTDGSVVFTTEFIEAMRKVQVLRAMDTTNTNGNATVHWSERTLPNFLGRAQEKGQSWEMLIQLANATGRDLWINVPVKVDDDYITKLAQLFRYGSDGEQPYTSTRADPVYPPLRSDLKLYVEYGNEIWNWGSGFYNYGWVVAMSEAAETPFVEFIARRSAFISQTFRSVWGDEAMMTQVRPIFSNQFGNGYSRLGATLRWVENTYGVGSASKIWWGGGGATYYDSTVAASDTQPATMQAYFEGLPSASYADKIKVDAVLLKAYGLRFIAYEGGPQPGVGKDASVANTYNTDPRMPERMAVAYDIFRANGGDMQVYYNYSSMGAPWWFIDGTKQLTVADTTSPKMRFLDTLATRPVASVTLGTSVPGTVYLRDSDAAVQAYAGGSSTWGYSGTAYQLNELKGSVNNEMLMVPVRTTAGGRYSVALTTLDANTSSRLELFVNGTPAGEFIPGTSSPAKTPALSNAVTVDLPQGLSVIRLRARTGSTWVRDIVVQATN